MITEFGVNNFKKFHGWSILPFSDITILVGGNSSGKSSFIKALILLIDNITNRGYSFFLDNGRLFFNFNAIGCENVNLGTFERVINDNSNKGPINICIKLEDNTDCRSIEFTINQFEADETLGYVSEIKVIDIVNGIKTKYKFNFTHHTVTLSIPYQDFIKSYQEVGTFRSQKIHDVKWIWEDMVDDYLPSDARHMAEEKLAILDSYSNELEKTHQPIIEIDDNLNGKLTLEHLKEPIHITNGYIEAVGAFKLSSHGDIISSAIDGIIIEPDNINYAHASSRITNYDKDSIIEKYLRRINIERNANSFPHIEYIYAHSITNKVFFPINERENYIARTLHEAYQTGALKIEEIRNFISEWLKKFKIGCDLDITNIEGEGYTIKVRSTNGHTRNLVDIGTGSAQIVLLLLKVAIILATRTNKSVLLVMEEPEQNMHPNFQSLLADLFFAIQTKGIKILVETHSEYFIRRSQVLVAQLSAENRYTQEELDLSNPFRVIYFPESGKPYDMHYKINGDFEQLFGDGFFDAAALNRMELYRLQLNQ